MAYCGPLGLPLTEFRGWDETSYLHAIAWAQVQTEDKAARCGSCGTVPDDWWHETVLPSGKVSKRLKPPEDAPFHVVGVECGGCQAIATARDQIDKERMASTRLMLAHGPDPDLGDADEYADVLDQQQALL